MQVPLYLRSAVSSYAAVLGGGTAYEEAGQIQLQGACVTDVFVHESTHAFDYINGNYGLSGSSAYLQALYEDACVPDEYAQSNNVECFAQDMVVFVYYLWNPSFFENVCMEWQIGYINTLNNPGLQAYKAYVGKHHLHLLIDVSVVVGLVLLSQGLSCCHGFDFSIGGSVLLSWGRSCYCGLVLLSRGGS